MKTYNIYFESNEKLNEYLEENNFILENKEVLVQIFSGIIDKSILLGISKTIKTKLPNSKIIGSTTSGEIFDDIVSDEKIVISFTVFEKSTLKISYVEDFDDDFVLGKKLSSKILEKNSKVFILFASGLFVNGEEFLNGVREEAPNTLVSGGLSGDNGNFIYTYLICDDKILENGAVGVSINSDELYITNDYSLAWRNIGKSFTVKKSHKKRVFDIDGYTPYELYKRYLGEEIAGLLPNIGVEFPLIIQKEDGSQVARAVLGANSDGSLEFAGNMPEGSKVKFGIGSVDSLTNGSAKVASRVSRADVESIFIYSCMARKVFMGKQADLDIRGFSDISNVSGFFTYGEFYSSKENNHLLNQTLTVLAMSETRHEKRYLCMKDKYKESKDMIRQNALSHLVNKTSKELENLNNELENKVKEKTQILEDLNKNLEKKVELEVQKNREKDIKLLEQSKMIQMNEMLKNVAHHWRQPLSVISTVASGIKINREFGFDIDDEIDGAMDAVLGETEKLSQTIESMMDLVGTPKNGLTISLCEEIDNTLSVVSGSLKNYGIKIKKKYDSSKCAINILQGELPHVLINIINNSKDAFVHRAIKKRWVKLFIENNEDSIFITVEDNAGGIGEDIMPKIFEPYFTTKHQSQGTGLSLNLCQRIVRENLRGNLYAQNTQRGVKFVIELPIGRR